MIKTNLDIKACPITKSPRRCKLVLITDYSNPKKYFISISSSSVKAEVSWDFYDKSKQLKIGVGLMKRLILGK